MKELFYNKKILSGVLAIVVALGLAGAGTMAYFSDTERVGQNTITAGTLDLQVDGQEEDSDVVPITVGNIAPGFYELKKYVIKNTGTIDGRLSIKFSAITNLENGLTEPEIADGDKTPDVGELGEYLIVYINIHDAYGDIWIKQPLNDWPSETRFLDIGSSYPPEHLSVTDQCGLLFAGETEGIHISIELPENVGNIVQSDSVEFDIIFHLVQVDQ